MAGTAVPRATPSEQQLPIYASWCTAVEGNTTFYGVPSAETVDSWAAGAPEGFRFMFKFPRTVTHEHRLRGAAIEDAIGFLEVIAPLGERCDPVAIQLPDRSHRSNSATSTGSSSGCRPPIGTRSRSGIRSSSPTPRRPIAWRRSAAADVEWIVFDTTTMFAAPPTSEAERVAWENKPRVRRRTRCLTDRPVLRYLGRDDLDATVAGWQRWLPRLAQWLEEGRSPTVFVHTPGNEVVPALARLLHEQVAALVPGLAPLPDPTLNEPETLFDA
ncbi:MAG: DUF72 domain-containing protein [Ilumatobacteraceae bacterium]